VKRLTILRHAKSSSDHLGVDDLDRPLNERGWKDAPRLGKELQQRGIRFDLVLASTAARVRETLDGLSEHFEFKAEIRFEPRLYLASEDTLLEVVRALSESVRAPLLVGHNPGLQQLLVDLAASDSEGRRERVAGEFSTAALAVVDLPAQRWAEVEPGTGNIVELIVPKELD
jgi:phosphohistidine phosphatase